MALISIVIPVYRSTESLFILARQLFELEKQLAHDFELVLVNDSPDFSDTLLALKEVRAEFPKAKVVTLRKNQGQHMALLVGLNEAKGEYIVTMDDDLQHPVREIPKLIEAISKDESVDVVFGVPGYSRKKHGLWRNLGSYLLNKFDSLFLEKPKNLVKSPFRIFSAEIAQVILTSYNATPSISSLLIKATNNIINIEVAHENRQFGKSHYTLARLISLSLNNILHYSSLPLKLVGFIGIAGFLFSFFFIGWILIRKLFLGLTFPGYASTVTLISFFGGLNLFALGLIGEYLIRIIKEQQKVNLESYIRRID